MLAAKFPKRREQFFLFEQLHHRSAFTTGDDESIHLLKIGSRTHLNGIGPGTCQRFFVCFEVALQGEHADLFLAVRRHHQPRVCSSSDSGSLAISMPNIAVPSSSLASRSFA